VIEPPPSLVDLVKGDKSSDAIWKKWFNNLYEWIKDLVASELQKTAFDELSVSQLIPQIQADFSYNINLDIWHKHQNNGTATVDSHRLKLSTGAAANQASQILSRVAVKYNAGQGGLFRATAIFTTGVANSEQLIGIGDVGDGYFFGYNGADFGVLRRIGGHQEVQTLTITTASSDIENITITLDGDAVTDVAVTDSVVISTTANEIAAHDYSDVGTGWEAHSDGDGTVKFVSYDSEAHAGAFTLGGATSAVGTFAEDIAGLAPTDAWAAQTAWSEDVLSGRGSAFTLDPTKGNVYQIRYQWLGYGAICFFVEDPTNAGDWALAHIIKYANANTLPSVNNPTLPIFFSVKNSSNTSDIVLYSASCMGGTEGIDGSRAHLHYGVGYSDSTGVGTTEVPILTLHNPVSWQGVPNRKRLHITATGVTIEGTKPAVARLRLNPALIATSFSSVNSNASVAEWDQAATTLDTTATGVQLYIGGSPKEGEVAFPIDEDFYVNPGELLTITMHGVGGNAGNTSMIPHINWEEEY